MESLLCITSQSMKHSLILFFTVSFIAGTAQLSSKTKNVFIVTIDGIRWQEVFNGADTVIINKSRFTSDVNLVRLMYLDSSAEQSRKKLLPFFWNVNSTPGTTLWKQVV